MIVFLILAHRNIPQLIRLIRTLMAAECGLLLHVDSATDLHPFERPISELRARGLRLVQRHRCPWAAFGLVEAMLAGMQQAIREFPAMTHLVVISGQDYPLQAPDRIVAFYGERPGLTFMEHHPLPRPDWPDGGLTRVTDLHLHVGERHIRLPTSALGLRRRVPGRRRPFQGGQNWSMSAECVQHVLRILAADTDYVRFFRRTAHADESFFQTLVLNSPLAESVVNDDLRFEDWSGGGDHPAVLTSQRFPELQGSKAHFAKKFDVSLDESVLDLIDERLLRAPTTPESPA